MARASSGSRPSISSIELFMSAKRMVTVFRSPSSEASGASAPAWIGDFTSAALCDLLSSGFPHSMQNLVAREFSVLQEGQRRVNGDAHSPQNFARSGLSAPHFEQRIETPNRLDAYRRTLTEPDSYISVRDSIGQALSVRQGSSVTGKSAIIDRASARRGIL